MQITTMKIRPTNTIKLFVRHKDYMTVMRQIRESRVKFYPVLRDVHFKGNIGYAGYVVEIETHSIATFLSLKYGLLNT